MKNAKADGKFGYGLALAGLLPCSLREQALTAFD